MKKIFIIPNTDKKRWKAATLSIVKVILESGRMAFLEPEHEAVLGEECGAFFVPFCEVSAEIDMIISLGGDGTLIAIAKDAAAANIPVLGINIGNLGYLVELDVDEKDGLIKVFSGEYTFDTRAMLDISVIRKSETAAHFVALNEALVSKGEISRLIDIEFYADSMFINKYRADGIIIATPTGSTAYSLSAGGPVIEPKTQSVVITPVCPHSLVSIPIVMSMSSVFEIKITERGDKDIYVTADGNKHFRLFCGDIVRVSRSNLELKLIRVKKRNFYAILRQKLEERM